MLRERLELLTEAGIGGCLCGQAIEALLRGGRVAVVDVLPCNGSAVLGSA